jgi:hypothetical protein
MPTEYKRKSDRDMSSQSIYDLAAEEVMLRNKSLWDAASIALKRIEWSLQFIFFLIKSF